MNQLLLKNKLNIELPKLDWHFTERPPYAAYARADMYKDKEAYLTVKVTWEEDDTVIVELNNGKHGPLRQREVLYVSGDTPSLKKDITEYLRVRDNKLLQKRWESLI